MARSCRGEAGGIRSLVDLIERDGEALDATLQAEYSISLGDVAARRVTFRRLRGLVANLPPDGTAVWRAQRRRYSPDDPGRVAAPGPDWWTADRDLLASIIDAGNLRLWQAGGGKGSKPLPIERPGHEAGRRTYAGTPMTPQEFLERWPSAAGSEHGTEERDVEERPHASDEDADDGEAGAAQPLALGGDEPRDGQRQAEQAEPDQ